MKRVARLWALLAGRRSIVRYAAIGTLSASIDFAFFSLLVQSLDIQISSAISVAMGMTTSYVLNSKFNFFKRLARRRAVRFLVVGLAGMALSAISLELAYQLTQNASISKLLTIPLVALLQFSLNRAWTFRDYE